LPEQPLKQLARIELHRQRRGRRAERDRRAIAAAVVAVARAAADRLLARDLERRERRFLADMLRGKLIGRDAAVRVVTYTRRDTAEPCAGRDRVGRAAGMAVLEPADDGELALERGERLEHRWQIEISAFLARRPFAHDCAVRKVDEGELRLRP